MILKIFELRRGVLLSSELSGKHEDLDRSFDRYKI